jgi:excisionase family DNA binding protein
MPNLHEVGPTEQASPNYLWRSGHSRRRGALGSVQGAPAPSRMRSESMDKEGGIGTRRMLTIIEAAAVLAVSRNTLKDLIYAGRVPAMRVGRQWRFDPALLEEWVAEEHRRQQG